MGDGNIKLVPLSVTLRELGGASGVGSWGGNTEAGVSKQIEGVNRLVIVNRGCEG